MASHRRALIRMRVLVEKWHWGQAFLRVLLFRRVGIIPAMLSIHSITDAIQS